MAKERKTHPIVVVQGGQWGSEAKGAIAAHLCLSRHIDFAVRTGAINAGHTVMYEGNRYAMQQVPTGWVNPKTQLVIGAGAYIHPDTLWREIDMINAAMPFADVRDRLIIDNRCGIHNEAAEEASKKANRHHSIGATGKGCSEAIVSKIRDRNNGYELFVNTSQGKTFRSANNARFADTVRLLNYEYDQGARILIEGTQGTLLDLHLGPYPFTTSRMTSAANWVAESGLSPALDYEVVLVCRTFPIRVAGNSGPMADEMEWTDLAREINDKLSLSGLPALVSPFAIAQFEGNMRIAAGQAVTEGKYRVPTIPGEAKFNIKLSTWTPSERNLFREAASELHRDALALCNPETVTELKKLFEMTTVTKKLRRLAHLNTTDLKFACAINRPSWIALTFADYLEPALAHSDWNAGAPTRPTSVQALHNIEGYIASLGRELGVPVKMISVGPAPGQVIRMNITKQEG